MSSTDSSVTILGFDPGLAVTGWGVIEKAKGKKTACPSGRQKVKVIEYGTIRTSPEFFLPQRLNIIFKELKKIIMKYKPDMVAMETLFFGANTKTAMVVGRVQGIIALTAGIFSIPVVEYAPLQVKMLITGYGRSKKVKIQEEVKKLLRLKKIPRPTHAADALAIAICCAGDESVIK